jgi:hypothetical protein
MASDHSKEMGITDHDLTPSPNDKVELLDLDEGTLDTVGKSVIQNIRYIDIITNIINESLIRDPEPEPEDFESDHAYQIAATAWDSRMANALHEAAELYGRRMALKEILEELKVLKRIMRDSKEK